MLPNGTTPDHSGNILVDVYDDADWSRLGFVLLHATARVLLHGTEHEDAVNALRDRYPQYRDMALEGSIQPAIDGAHAAGADDLGELEMSDLARKHVTAVGTRFALARRVNAKFHPRAALRALLLLRAPPADAVPGPQHLRDENDHEC